MLELIETLKMHKAGDRRFYVSGNLLVFYEPGNRLRHVAPDVFVVRGVPNRNRDHYLIWEEGKGPEDHLGRAREEAVPVVPSQG